MRVLLVVYDNGSYIHEFPLGVGYIAATLEQQGHEVDIYSQDLNHWPEEHLTAHLEQNRYDVVGLSFIGGYYQYRKAIKISRAINASRNRPFYVLGGHGPAPEPDFFLKKMQADAVVIGEGEETVVALLQALEDKTPLSAVKGIAFREGEQVTVNPRRELIQDIDAIPMPAFHKFNMSVYRLVPMTRMERTAFAHPVLSGRGCIFECNFCYRLDKGHRPRKAEVIIEEIELLHKDYGITYICFFDELLMSSVSRTVELCEAFIKHGLHKKIIWNCNGRLNFAKKNVLRLMKEAGCVFINYGIESFDDKMLRVMRKGLTTKQVVKGVENTLEVGISPGLNIIFGNIGETREVLEKGVDFLIKYDDHAQMRTIRPVTPYPGSELYDIAVERGLIENCEDFYENKHMNSDLLAVNFTDMTDDEVYEALISANTKLLDHYFETQRGRYRKQVDDLYRNRDASFRGFRQT